MAICKFNPKLVSQVYFDEGKAEFSPYGPTWCITHTRLFVSLDKSSNVNKSNDQITQFINVMQNSKGTSDIKSINFYGTQGLEALDILFANKVIDSKLYETLYTKIKHSAIANKAAYDKLINEGYYPDKLYTDTFYGDIKMANDLKAKQQYLSIANMKDTTDDAIASYIRKQREEMNSIPSKIDFSDFLLSLKFGQVENPDL